MKSLLELRANLANYKIVCVCTRQLSRINHGSGGFILIAYYKFI
jgi:hypothetical protein